tara:strand:+ start:2258 stop:2503 length:246 start_codon:yes stop_codon:yes gene_type:complete
MSSDLNEIAPLDCGLCKKRVAKPDVPGVTADYEGEKDRGLCKECLEFLVSFSLSNTFAEAEAIAKAEPRRFQSLKEKLEVV